MDLNDPHRWVSAVRDGQNVWVCNKHCDAVMPVKRAPLCKDTPLDNDSTLPKHDWMITQHLWVCRTCRRATVGRPVPVCQDGEHQWSQVQGQSDVCGICLARVIDLFRGRGIELGSTMS